MLTKNAAKTARERALFRARRRRWVRLSKASIKVAHVHFDGAVLDFLFRNRWLVREADAEDARKVGKAIARLLLDAFGPARRPLARFLDEVEDE